MSGAAIAQRISAGIARAGQRTGSGALTAEILREEGADESVYPPVPGSEAGPFSCNIMFGTYTTRDYGGTEITAKDVKIFVAADAESDPRNGDRIRVDGEVFHIQNVTTVKPGNVVLLWICQARKADG